MATTKITLIDEKIDELKKAFAAMQNRDTKDPTSPTYVAKSTQRTQLYHISRDRRVLHLLRTLIAANPDVVLNGDDQETFVLLTTLASERVVTKYQFNVGDNLLDIMTKYENLSRKDLDAKLEKLGLRMNYETKKVEEVK